MEDHHFMDLVAKSTRLVSGHDNIGLPLRQANVRMPSNKMIVEQRALSLKRRFKRDKLFNSEYANSVNDLISKGYAERVPDDCLGRCDGRVWYVPHHGVYHPQKRKLRAFLTVEQRSEVHPEMFNSFRVQI